MYIAYSSTGNDQDIRGDDGVREVIFTKMAMFAAFPWYSVQWETWLLPINSLKIFLSL